MLCYKRRSRTLMGPQWLGVYVALHTFVSVPNNLLQRTCLPVLPVEAVADPGLLYFPTSFRNISSDISKVAKKSFLQTL
jgi:hypothetical protein